MGINVNDFFRPIKLQENSHNLDYTKVKPYIQCVRSMSLVTYQSIYLIDYYRRGFAYISDNPIFLCGKTPAQVLREGYLFYLQNVPMSDLELLLKINEAGFHFYNNIPSDEKTDYSISYDFHLMQSTQRTILINHKLTPLLLDRDANIWIALCLVSLSSHRHSGNIEISKRAANTYYEFDMAANKWIEREKAKLNRKEKEVLIMSGQGVTMGEMAERLFISLDTVKFHRKNILKKLNAKNISEAIAAAANHSII